MLIGGARTDVTADLQEATRDFAAFYERHAYLVYNLALRITCERASAMAAAEQSFLEHASKPEDPAALVSSVVTAALANARPRPRAEGAGGPEEEALLACSARALSARERALLAVPALTEGEPDAQAGAAYAKLAETRGESVADTEAAYAGWLWAAPPPVLWEGLYPKFYRAAERALAAPAEDDVALTQKLPRQRKPKRRRSLSGLKFTLALLLPALVIAGAVAWPHLRPQAHEKTAAHATGLQSAAADSLGSSSQDQAAIPSALTDPTQTAPAQKKRKPLTPQQLDQLRRNELHALQLYSMRQEDRRLTQAQRDYAAQKIALLRDLAQRRIDAIRRERQLAREQRILARKERRLQRERQKSGNGNQTLNVVTNDGSSGGNSQPPQNKSSGGAPQNSSQAQQQCLYDANNGTYICQQ